MNANGPVREHRADFTASANSPIKKPTLEGRLS
jgi:hypothetical protein